MNGKKISTRKLGAFTVLGALVAVTARRANIPARLLFATREWRVRRQTEKAMSTAMARAFAKVRARVDAGELTTPADVTVNQAGTQPA